LFEDDWQPHAVFHHHGGLFAFHLRQHLTFAARGDDLLFELAGGNQPAFNPLAALPRRAMRSSQ
jgi:hypothetical protein